MMSRSRFIVLCMAALAGAVALLVFWPCVHNGFTHWDDTVYLDPVVELRGLSVQSVGWAFTQSVNVAGYYHPVTWLSFLLDYRLWGLRPFPYHATNLLLHVLNTVLLIVYVEKFLRAVPSLTEFERYAVNLAVAIVFAIHPLQVESVAWIAERKTLLCAAFIIASLYAQMKRAEQPTKARWWWAMNGWFVLALLAKPMAVPLPGVMLVLDWYPLRRHETLGWWRLWKEKLPMFLLSVISAGTALFTQSHQDAIDIDVSLGVMDRVLVTARSFVFYAWKLVWPAWLSPFYPLGEEFSIRNVEYYIPLLICASVAVMALTYRRRQPAIAAAVTVYVLLLAPVSGVIPFAYAVADRYAYLSMVPVVLLGASAGVLLWRHVGRTARAAVAILVGCQLLFYASTTRGQVAVWRNDETLWRTAWSHFPNSAFINFQVAQALCHQARFQEALPYALRAREFNPDLPEGRATLGLVELKLRRYGDAAAELREAIRMRPKLLAARYNLACAYARLERFAEAYDVLRELLVAHPEYATLAVRDGELAGLRNHPDYAARFAALVGAAKN